jgi:nucleotide-binding universal stress UspA family protein
MQAEAARNLVENVATRVRAKGVRATSFVELGDPRAKILELAETWHADLIVVGSDHNERGWRGICLVESRKRLRVARRVRWKLCAFRRRRLPRWLEF